MNNTNEPIQVTKAKANGSMDRINSCISLATLLIYEANNLMSEVDDVLRMNGLKHGKLKMLFNRYLKSQDILCADLFSLIRSKGSGMDVCNDLDEFDNHIRERYNLPKGWKPKQQ